MHWRKLNPLGSVLGKIWLSFWITLIFIVLAVYFVSFQVAQTYQIAPPAPRHIDILTNIVLPDFTYVGNDYTLIANELEAYNAQSRLQWYLVDSAYQMLGTPKPPSRILVMLSEMIDKEGMQVGQWRSEAWLGPMDIPINGQNFRLFLRGVPNLPPANLPFWMESQWVRVVFALVVSGLMSLILSWSIVRPLEKLRTTTKALASGTLDARAGSSVSRRSDEIGELGRDFDDMASRIEKLVAAQKRLLGNVSHELRSPLTRLQVAMGIVRQKSPPELDKALNRIERESDRLENLIAQILKLSRFENDMLHVEFQKVDFSELVAKVVEDARFESSTRAVTITDDLVENCTLFADPQLMHSIVDNVLRNALRFSPENGELRVEMTHTKKQISLYIIDQGPGVPDDKLARLFDPFYRLDQTNTGAGLGLNIALQAVQLHNGKITASNNKDGGLTVEILLPLT
ncbi:sensor histidine kinase [Reinekea sp.]|uniref:sensor histidine kinase n=1 Tax=Reinekea sp. TaxID=1970455 RepID=UPI003989A180